MRVPDSPLWTLRGADIIAVNDTRGDGLIELHLRGQRVVVLDAAFIHLAADAVAREAIRPALTAAAVAPSGLTAVAPASQDPPSLGGGGSFYRPEARR